MKTHSYNPHISQNISGFELRLFENPDVITKVEQVENDSSTLKMSYDLVGNESCWELIDTTFLVFRWKSKLNSETSYLAFDSSGEEWTWNAIIPFSYEQRGGTTKKVYLSMLYWDTPIKAMGARFEHLRLNYYSKSVISADTDFVDIASDYSNHVEKAGAISSIEIDRHSYLDSKLYHSNDSTQPITSTELTSNVKLTSGNSEVIKSKFTDDFDFRCIDLSKGYDSILTSKDLGLIGIKDNTAYFSNDSMNLPTPPKSEYHKLYFYGQQVLVCYYPDSFECYYTFITNYNDNNTVNWDSWQLLGSGSQSFKVIIPEYFNILPLALIFMNRQWRVIHILDFNDYNYLNVNMIESGNSVTDFPELGVCIVPTLETFMKDVDAGIYLRNWLYNDMYGYEDENSETKNRIMKYWSSQLYISLQTFIQCLRFFPEYERIEVLNCGCLCSSTGKRSVFVPYSPIIEQSSRTVSMKSIPEGSKVDNLVYYIENQPYINSLVDNYKVTASKNIKQICNGVILYV